MAFGVIRFMALGWIEDHYLNPIFHFRYYGFEWIQVPSASVLYGVHVLMLLSAILVAVGWKYRVASVLLFLTFTYTELLDLTYYLNHYYFVSWVSFLLIFLPANASFSIDAWLHPKLRRMSVPAWTIYILQFQVAVVYVFAGIAKMNATWLFEALPLRIWLPAKNSLWGIGPLFDGWATAYLFSWVGMLYDTTIIGWLLWSKSRPIAFFSVIVFHTLTGILFQIGIFPWVMIAAVLIYFSPEWHLKWQTKLSNIWRKPSPLLTENVVSNARNLSHFSVLILGCYVLFQLLFPLRCHLYPGNLLWTEQGYRFGWRVMLMEKAGTATFYVQDNETGHEGEVFNGDFLNAHQEKQMAMQPDMILQYAHFLGRYYEKNGVKKPKIRASVYVTLNGQPSRLLFDEQLDLMKIKDTWTHKDWLNAY